MFMQINFPLVSVITPCYNDGKYILDCVLSVQKSTYPNIEHIIVDDGSNEETKEILKQIKYPNVQIITKRNEGVCIARNLAINKSKGKYILPVDGDDYIDSNFIFKAVNLFEQNENYRIITSELTQCFGCSDKIIQVVNPNMGLLLARNLFTIFTMFKREDALKVGGFDLQFAKGLEDWEFWISILELGGEIGIIPGVNTYYRIKKTHRNNNIGGIEGINELRYLIWQKHKNLYAEYYMNPVETEEYIALISRKSLIQRFRQKFNFNKIISKIK